MKFKSEDFATDLTPLKVFNDGKRSYNEAYQLEMVVLAQAAFDKWAGEQIVVYGYHDRDYSQGNGWLFDNLGMGQNHTHQARLILIEELPKKNCEHKKVYVNNLANINDFYFKCVDCHKTVSPKNGWELAE